MTVFSKIVYRTVGDIDRQIKSIEEDIARIEEDYAILPTLKDTLEKYREFRAAVRPFEETEKEGSA